MATRRRRLRDLETGVKRMQREGQGVWKIELVGPADRVWVVSAALEGDPKWAAVVRQIIPMISAQPSTLCLLCPAEFSRSLMPHVLVLLTAHTDKPTQMMLNGVCEGCAAKHADFDALGRSVLAYYRINMLSDARPVVIHPASGRA